jgi:mono/diheme cytochrome c family protein
MNKYNLSSFIALLVFVVAIPLYASMEPSRMDKAERDLQRKLVAEGADLYLDYCAMCHGVAGEGFGIMPALNHPALSDADPTALFKTIARAAHGTVMASWHMDEGGVLNDYQIQELVVMIQNADWGQVGQLSEVKGVVVPHEPAAEWGQDYLDFVGAHDAHQCVACHEDPDMHAGRFGLDCARCHSTIAWTPALLTKHTFLLDHGGQGKIDCLTCHLENYYQHTCYECHDHKPTQMEEIHLAEGIFEYEACVDCHPTGEEGEAEQLMKTENEVIGADTFSPVTESIPVIAAQQSSEDSQ